MSGVVMLEDFDHTNDLEFGVRLCETILCEDELLLTDQLNTLLQQYFWEFDLRFMRQLPVDRAGLHISEICLEHFYVLSGKAGILSETDFNKMNSLTAISARLFSNRLTFMQQRRQEKQSQLIHTQIMDHIHESVITMDLAGFILSWNAGAERLFGYSAAEALGRNVLFLYESEESVDAISKDSFLENGGREMEVRRRKKTGEIFWASLSLSTLFDEAKRPIGMIGYLSDITGRKCSEEKINHLAYYDSLTDFPNRTLFKKLVDSAIGQSQRNDSTISIMFIDLNRFKLINDTLGHGVGDQLLKQVASRFRLALRENDVIARLGSDEFAIALIDVKQHFYAGLVAQKLLETLEGTFAIGEHDLRVGASIGISIYPQDGSDAEDLLQKADIAMFKAKRFLEKSSGSYAFYDVEMNQSITSRLYLESGLRRALRANEFFLLFQPKVDIASGRVRGAEALIRWNHPRDGMIAPAQFIPVAEEINLIAQIDAWVLDTACAQARLWQDQGVSPFRIAVNISAKEFTASFPAKVAAALYKHGISASWIELEITESMLMQNTDLVVDIMREITRLGVSLALDDFGTGFSSLSYLKRFPIHTLKIDRSFIQGIPDDVDDCAIASAIISMAKQMKHRVIAEGVETQAQLSFLQAMGCDEIQGYLFSRPVDSDVFFAGVHQQFDLTRLGGE
ncbi:MAG: EAL domain-containing protein [Burkholderiales bacterium]|nr:EAL domain-containing protein [Burkholderiales bacterium]